MVQLMDSEKVVSNDVFARGGEMGALMRQFDWSQSPTGPVEQWPQSLKTIVRVLLTSRYAMWMGWGPELTFLYNDSYASMTLGKKHPWALGRPASEVWKEIWDEIGPRIRHVLDTGEATWDEALLLFLERSGFPEETYHTFSYSPLTGDDGSIAGMLCVVTEETERVVGDRQLTLLRALSSELASSIAELDVCKGIKRALDTDPIDLPFTLTYLISPGEKEAQLVCSTGIEAGQLPGPHIIDTGDATAAWPIAEVLNGNSAVLVEDLETRFPSLPGGQWGTGPGKALLVPIARQGQESPAGVFIAALNPFRQLTPAYKGFVDLIAGQIAASLANARAYHEERRRAEALAAIDQAKTAFFTNISHEFRTPLTLMLSPLEEAISRTEGTVSGRNTEYLKLAHRNAMRLLKLVNTLLEFSQIEARRANPVYQPTDLSEFTAELASVFRSATEKAGLNLRIECGPLSRKVSVDREMWEKIVLNLLSNAFKFTLEGSITVRLTEDEGTEQVTLEVADTGTGIAQAELPRIFERFHRVKGAQGRSIEGTGIGLALVQELVKLHNGAIRAESEYGKGTTFFVTIPRRTNVENAMEAEPHWSPASTRFRAENYVEEALRWLPDAPVTAPPAGMEAPAEQEAVPSDLANSRVLLADDNADMREYVRRLLAQRFQVRAVANGAEALAAALADPPDLVLSDVMMPEMDGFALLRALRDNPKTRSLPVILLSARAGMEARVEGLELGADDYLVKPFTAQELLARTRSQLRLARLRREAADERTRLALIAESSSDFISITDAQGIPVFLNKAGRKLVGLSENFDVSQTTMPEYFIPEERAFVQSVVLPTLFHEGRWAGELRLRHWKTGEPIPVFHDVFRMDNPETGEPISFASVTRDLTEQKKAEEALRRSEKLAVVGRMASSISHEINNPLESVTNLLYLIQSTTAEEKSKSYARTALEELARVSYIVTHTLQFNRQTDEAAPVKLSELLESAIAIYAGRLRSSDIRLVREFDEEALAQSLPSEIRQVFSNLISNAFDAMRSGGTLFLRARATVHRRTGKRAVRVTIADTGHGMDRETRAQIFEPFFTTKGDHGTGLGLWISAEILKRHQAEMHVKSSCVAGHSGSVFSMLFTEHSQMDTRAGIQRNNTLMNAPSEQTQ